MAYTLALLHTSHVLIPLFSQLAKEHLPGIGVFHMSDESLIKNTMASGGLTKATVRRLGQLVGSAHEGGADGVLVTCSSIGAAVPLVQEIYDFPVMRIDEAMAETAVQSGKRIGVAATVRTTLEPTIALLNGTAARLRREIQIVPALADGAFEAVLAGDTERHDALVKANLAELMKEVDLIVLAQASMTRVVAAMDVSGAPPILSSPELALKRAWGIISKRVS